MCEQAIARAYPKLLADHACEDEGHDLVQVGLQLNGCISHQAAQCLQQVGMSIKADV